MKKKPRKSVADEILNALTEFTEKLEKGEEIKATEVSREQTPDGPLHTFEKTTRFGKKYKQ